MAEEAEGEGKMLGVEYFDAAVRYRHVLRTVVVTQSEPGEIRSFLELQDS